LNVFISPFLEKYQVDKILQNYIFFVKYFLKNFFLVCNNYHNFTKLHFSLSSIFKESFTAKAPTSFFLLKQKGKSPFFIFGDFPF